MTMIYRRNPHHSGGTGTTPGRVTTTIPLHHSTYNEVMRHRHDHDDNDKDEDSIPSTRSVSRWLRCRPWWRSSSSTTTTSTTTHGLNHQIAQILWLALLVYAFFGLPVLGRILNFCRYYHRFTVPRIITGLLAGFLQDFAIFVQASTVIVLIKTLFQPATPPQRRLSVSAPAMTLGGSSATTALAQERYPHSYGNGGARYVHLPVYFPVRTNEYELAPGVALAGESDGLDPPLQPKHLTLVASSSSSTASFPWSLSSSVSSPSSPASVVLAKLRSICANLLAIAGIQIVLILSTVASVADFCLQITMHPRLNRAFVEIFFNYADKFTGSLVDEEVLTPAVIGAWATYVMLITTMTYGIYADRLPSLPDLLSQSPSSSSGSSSSGCCFGVFRRMTSACTAAVRRRSYRKDSSITLPASQTDTASEKPPSFIKSLYQSYWRKKEADIIVMSDVTATTAPRGWRRRRNSSQGHVLLGQPSVGFAARFGWSSTGSTSMWMSPTTPLGVLLHCIVVSVFITLGALCVSLLVHSATGGSGQTGSKKLVGVDMQLLSNPMFSLQTENFFTHKSRVGADHINCTEASATLLSTLGKSEVYETEGMGNGDSCALLWRKTTGFHGDTLWDIEWNVTKSEDQATLATPLNVSTESNTTANDQQSPTPPSPRLPNIIVLNMESWRHLDVGVLGGAAKKAKYNKSVTPNFDRFSKQGVLYRKHYTQCVQTTRTLLTTLFGMLPSCTETTALKMYGTGLTVRGLPQFLKDKGYFNMFWSAVDLKWEYWDQFLSMNGFDKLVDDKKIRKMLHEVRNYQDRADDHFSWGMHDHLSFDMLLHALETAKNNTMAAHALNASEASLNSSLHEVNSTFTGSRTVDLTVGTAAPSIKPTASDEQHDETNSPTQSELARIRRDKHRHRAPTATPVPQPASVHGLVNVSDMSATKRPPVGWEGLREPYFIDMYTITSHNPWALPLDYIVPDLSELYTRFNKRYIDAMYFSDDMLGWFIDNLRAKGLMNNTIVIIEGDHGYGRLEHNNPSIADSALYDEGSRVPFLILADDFLPEHQKGTEVNQLTMQSDLMATIADIIGVSPEDPLYQHGYGHSMRRRRNPKPKVKDVDFDVIRMHSHLEKERHVLMCNPFNGLTKGVRTEDFKYVYNPDGSYKVFALDEDPGEKHPVQSGYDVEQMDDVTRSLLTSVSTQVDLNQFLYETNKFRTPLPTPTTEVPIPTRQTEEEPMQTVVNQLEHTNAVSVEEIHSSDSNFQ